MFSVVDVLFVFVVIGVVVWGEKGFGLLDKFFVCFVFVEVGEVEKVG